MKKYCTKLTALIVLLTFSLAFAETIEHDSGLTVTYPDNWSLQVDPEDDDSMVMNGPDDKVVYFAVEAGSSPEKPVAEVLAQVGEIVKGAKMLDEETLKVNGMNAYRVTGYGDSPQDYWIALYVEYDGKIFEILGIGQEPGWRWDPDEGEVASVVYSLKPKK
jgi:hypothetical protein